jgi:hypothetical protein
MISIDILQEKDNKGYGATRIPNTTDESIGTLIDEFIHLGDNERETVTESIQDEHIKVLLAYAERMSSYAIRTNNQNNQILCALIAVSFTYDKCYFKEVVPVLCLIFNSIQRLSLSEDDILKELRQVVPGSTALIDEFNGRSQEDKQIDAFGYLESKDEDGFRYKRDW